MAVSTNTLITVAIAIALLALLYYLALPKPIPGIPHNASSARSVLGDIPSMLAWKKQTRENFSWMTLQCQKLNSPVVQIFPQPFSLPWVIVADARECQDVLFRRAKEFDRAKMITDSVGPILREHFFPMPTGPKQKAHRALLADTMTNEFLHEVAAPQLYEKAVEMLQLWNKKMSLAKNHPFAADVDIDNFALDTIWAASVGSEANATKTQLDHLNKMCSTPLPESPEEAVEFTLAAIPYDITAIRTVISSIEVGITSPLPSLTYWFHFRLPWIHRAFSHKDAMLTTAFNDARSRFEDEETYGTQKIKSAMDHILRREIKSARKESRPPQFETTVLKDELFGFLLAGHETTSTTVNWGLKFMTDHQDVQQKLRETLYSAIPAARGRQPTYSEIVSAKMPYFDAVVEEMLRCGGTVAVQSRKALVDTEVLGYRIPKGADVLFMTNGPTFIAPAIKGIEESSRSESSRSPKGGKLSEWDPEKISQFDPERWLKTNESGEITCDLNAGPNIQFGGGPRACFGKKFAYLEIRTIFSLIFWNYKLLPVAPELSSYRGYDCVTHHPQQCYIRLEAI